MPASDPLVVPPEKSVSDHLVKLALDLLPLVLFFGANLMLNIFWATGLCMVATVASLIASRVLLKRIPVMALVTGAGVVILGGLTIWLHNDTFIKIKPTIVNMLFASALLGGLYFNQLFVKTLLEEAVALTDEGWRRLQLRWGLFFVLLAVLNEVVWRTCSTNVWAGLKLANIPLTLIFMFSQIGLFRDFAPAAPELPAGTSATSMQASDCDESRR